MSGGGGGLLALLGLGLAAAAASSSSRGAVDRTAEATRALSASDEEARRAGFVDLRSPRGRVILPTEADVERIAGAGTLTPIRKDPRLARRLAGPLARELRNDGAGPLSRPSVARFQAAAGMVPTGYYDAATARELARYGIRNAPAPWFDDEPMYGGAAADSDVPVTEGGSYDDGGEA